MAEFPASGLTADWLNAWLAAIGVTVLLPDARLRWSDDPLPQAMFDLPDSSEPLADRVAAALPRVADYENLTIARLPRKVTLPEFQARARQERASGGWSLSSSLTDLAEDQRGEAAHGPLDPPAPRGETLYTRLIACRKDLDGRVDEAVAGTLAGTAVRRPLNGLGFDFRRLSAGTNTVDPVVECLAFEAMSLLPFRGNGKFARQRGWTAIERHRGALTWPAWNDSLDCWAIDALLDTFYSAPNDGRQRALVGVTARFGSVPYRKKADMDSTRAYASERIW